MNDAMNLRTQHVGLTEILAADLDFDPSTRTLAVDGQRVPLAALEGPDACAGCGQVIPAAEPRFVFGPDAGRAGRTHALCPACTQKGYEAMGFGAERV